jgi:predicted aminopeptidase
MRFLAALFPLIFLLFTLTGCGDLLYLSRLGWHQSSIALHSVPVEEVLQDPKIPPRMKEKILFIREVKHFGEKELGLTRTKNYSTFFETQRPVLHVVTAAEKDRLLAYTWTFPVVGKVTYKSFFTGEGAQKEKRKLDEEGYDTVVQPVDAYSTLGWFRDPVFSPMLEWDEATLANLILHEMAHATVYFKGRTDFNEQLATFVGNQGAIHFLKRRYGSGSKEVARADQIQKDDILFSNWIDRVYRRLADFYREKISRDEKLEKRKGLFRSVQEEFQSIKADLKTGGYDDFGRTDLNNAVLLAYHRYVQKLDLFQALYERLGRDPGKVVEFFKEIQKSGEDPASSLERATSGPLPLPTPE